MYKDHEIIQIKRDTHDPIHVPDNLDQYILTGIELGKRQRKAGFAKRFSVLAAGLVLISFITLARVSPVFADYLSDVPILEKIIKLINYDKGLKAAVDNNFLQPINKSDEHEGISLTVDSIIVDEARLIIFYTLENNSSYQSIGLSRVELLDQKGEHISAGYSYSRYNQDDNTGQYSEMISVSFTENSVIPDVLTLKTNIEDMSIDSEKANIGGGATPPAPKLLDSIWAIEIPIDKSKFENIKEFYDINEEVVIEGQKIHFEGLTIYPTRIALDVYFDPNNTKKIFCFDDLRLEDETGEVWAAIGNGISASIIDENHQILYFESSFFKSPEYIMLRGSSIRALDKASLDVTVDLKSQALLKTPDDRLKLNSITKSNGNIALSFVLRKDSSADEGRSYMIFSSEFYDEAGSKYYDGGSSSSSGGSSDIYDNEITLYIPDNDDYKGTLTFKLSDYPARIKGDFRIKIK